VTVHHSEPRHDKLGLSVRVGILDAEAIECTQQKAIESERECSLDLLGIAPSTSFFSFMFNLTRVLKQTFPKTAVVGERAALPAYQRAPSKKLVVISCL